jgi:predicted amidohydrolase
MQDLTLSLIQEQLHWHAPEANRQQLARHIRSAPASDLILLPEMFSTGFSLESEQLAESMAGESVQWMANMAQESGAVIAGTLIIEERGHYYNRLIWMRPDGSHVYYDKRHLFRMVGEERHYSPGQERIVETLNGWRICPLICYDLRFPVWSRNRGDYDLLIYLANWPEARRFHWQSLLRARAIENLTYVGGLNCVGVDGNNITYSGDSVVLGPKGDEKLAAGDQVGCFSYRLDYAALSAYRQSFPAHLDADPFDL